MTDRELEQRLRAWYAAQVVETETAPEDLRASLAAIPATAPAPLRPISRRQGFTLLAAAAILVLGGALAAGSDLLRLTAVVPPAPSDALLATPGPSSSEAPTPPPTPVPTANVRPGGLIAFIRNVDKQRTCSRQTTICPTPRLWVVGADGTGAHELLADGVGSQGLLGWTGDGTRLLYTDDGKLYLTDPSDGRTELLDTGCPVVPLDTPLACTRDSQFALSRDGKRIVFVRETSDKDGYSGPTAIATMDLESGQVAVLNATTLGAVHPDWSPDGSRIVFFRYGEKDTNGPDPVVNDATFVIDADGQDLHQISPTTLGTRWAEWSPDGGRIVFESGDEERQDIYTMRSNGTDVRRLTTDGKSMSATWAPDGRILFTRLPGSPAGAAGWWTMGADGSDAVPILPASAVVAAPEQIASTNPAWQPIGGAAIVPPPWAPRTAAVVGPPAPTPTPTPIPDLAPGFSWTGSWSSGDDSPLGETATLLADGRVLFAGGCETAAQLYDPATGTFSPTDSLTVVRASVTATRLRDGRVLFAGGYNCARAGQDGTWASAELYDPSTGTFAPTGSLAAPRQQHTATLLADGRVLIAGGLTGPSPTTAGGIILAAYRTAETDAGFLASAEIYDPRTGTFSKTDSMSAPHRGHTATLLQDGRVLVVGNGGEASTAGKVADVYDPATGTFSRTGSMKTGRWLHTATLLTDGRVLILGGRSPNDSVHASAELYDPKSGKFSSAGSLREGRQQHTATLLQDGRVLIMGGYWSDGQKWNVLSSTEMYDPGTGGFSPIGSMGARREGHSATLLVDGRVLIAGGEDIRSQGGVGVTSAVLYQP